MFEIFKVFFISFIGIIRASFSALFSFLPFYNFTSSFIDAFSTNSIICGLLGISGILAFITKLILIGIKRTAHD